MRLVLILLVAITTHISAELVDLLMMDSSLSSSAEVSLYRKMVVMQNLEMIRSHNSNPQNTYTMMAYPEYIGRTFEELSQLMLSKIRISEPPRVVSLDLDQVLKIHGQRVSFVDLPQIIDLRPRARTPIYQQGYCGNCYAYSTTDSVTMMKMLASRPVPLLSMQHLTDCTSERSVQQEYRNFGCKGGYLGSSLNFIRDKGLYILSQYPLNQQMILNENSPTPPCNTLSQSARRYKISYSMHLESGNEQHRKLSLKYNIPVPSGIAANKNFMLYKSGIFNGCAQQTPFSQINHAVILMGYHMRSDFWIIKNSWGKGWGQNGFMRIDMDTDCGVLMYGAIGYG